MKLAFVMHNLIRGNGQGRIQYEVVRHLLEQGHEATLFADNVAPELVQWGARWEKIPNSPRRPALIGGYRFANAADRMIARRRGEFDLVVGAGFTLRSRHDVSFCQFVHGAWLRSPVHVSRVQRGPAAWYQYLYTRVNWRWERQSYAAASRVVAPSRKIVEELVSIGVGREKIRLVYNGVDLEEFHPGRIEPGELGIPAGLPTALFVGDIRTPRKNLDSVLKALKQTPGLRLVVVGAVERSPFPQLAAQLGVADRVHFAGYRRDVAKFMRACDLFVFPSRYEAGTLVLIEAMASGLPIITARTAGGCEVMEGSAQVILEDPDDVEGLVAAMRRFAQDSDARQTAAKDARQIAERYSWRDMAAQYLSIFQELSAARPAELTAHASPA